MTEYLMFQEVCFEMYAFMYVFIFQQRYNKIRYQYKKVSCMKKEENELNCFQGLFRTQIKLFT